MSQKLVLDQEARKRIQEEQRYGKAKRIFEHGIRKSKSTMSDIWCVPSGSKKGVFYCVRYDKDLGLTCDCPHFMNRGTTCCHQIAVALLEVS
jgi:hypothetical protein